jgi:pimeloyl-ACP methyl ester carboxylesterase
VNGLVSGAHYAVSFMQTDILERLNIERTGPDVGRAVLVLHGWGSSALNMRPLADALSDQYRVWNVDMPGHGNSPPPPEPWGVPEHAALVRALIDEEMGGRAVIVGHSNGGRISLYMASDPDLSLGIEALVLVSPSGIRPRRSAKYKVRRAVAETLKAPFQVLPEPAREFGLDWLRHSLVWKLLGSSDYRALEGVMRETFVKTVNCYLDDRVDRINIPVLLFWGTRDEAVSRYQMDQLCRKLPDCGLVELEGAGHYGYLEHFDTVVEGIRTLLDPEDVIEEDAQEAGA